MLGRRIKERREAKGITQVELSEKLGISQQLLSYYEVTTRKVPYEMLVAIADFLECTTDYLLGRDNVG